MSSSRIFTGLFAFAGGFLSGILFAPQSGSETRDRLAQSAKSQLDGMDEKIQQLEKQLTAVREQLKVESESLTQKVKRGSERVRSAAAESILPEVPDDPEAFKVDDGEVVSDLRHLPRK